MKRNHWITLGLALTVATAGASAPPAPRAFSFDIHADEIVKSNYACGHWATTDGSIVSGLDWAVNGTVVAENAETGMNWYNDGSPYLVSIGVVNSKGGFTAYYSETFYPQNTPWVACFQV